MDATLIESLQSTELYPHDVKDFHVMQTHLSWVILTGNYAYKIKKPLNLGFQDFTTLEKRKHYCELELSLNKRLAPNIYIDVIPITGSASKPVLGGTGEPIEYAIKMNQFDQENMLLEQAKQGKVTPKMIKSIAQQLATFHLNADKAEPNSRFGEFETIVSPMVDNFNALMGMPFSKPWHPLLTNMKKWTEDTSEQFRSILSKRKEKGWIRATHGDVHLGNIVLINNKPVIFDCIEFNEDFRWTDTMNDVGFMFMDLCHNGLTDLGYVLVNHYLERSGDYEGLVLLPYFACYRAMVRAKVMGFQMSQTKENTPEYETLKMELDRFLQLANQFTQTKQPALRITVGISGSGKSSYTEKFMALNQYVRLRSDVIRKQLFNLPLYEPTPENLKDEVYSQEASEKVFQQLHEWAKLFLHNHQNVVIDATCIKHWQRELFQKLAQQMNVDFQFLVFEADIDDIEGWIAKRQRRKQVSDATLAIAKAQLENFDPLNAEEEKHARYVTKKEIVDLIES